jgi:DNA polymerase (family 10)
MDNKQYAQILEEIAVLRALAGHGTFKVRAYENAARAVTMLPHQIDDWLADGKSLTKFDGIGKSTAKQLKSIWETGKSPLREELLEKLDPGLLEMTKIQGLGPKRIKLIYDELGVSNIDLLRDACERGDVQKLSGLGKKTEEKILHEIERLAEATGRIPLPAARVAAESIADALRKVPGVEQVEVAGSIRRGRETIGDIDVLVTTRGDHDAIFEAFVNLPEVGEVLARGDTKTSARLVTGGMQVDVRIVGMEQFGAALHYFTGSKEHNIEIRARAKAMGLRVNEYGVLNLETEEMIETPTEEELFGLLGLAWVPPEMREGRGEVALAESGGLPDLVTAEDVRGDFHMHTTASDGKNSIMEMAEAAKQRGYEFIVVTDHSKVVTVANGLDEKRFAEHIDAIRAANEEIEDFDILVGLEVDILSDGSLDMDHGLLADCDWVVGSIHTAMNQEADAMTARLLRAMETGLLHMLGHPTGRRLGGRDGYHYDFERVVGAAVDAAIALEINGGTGMLDFNAENARRAHELGATIVLGSDAHSVRELANIDFAIQQSRRASLDKAAVLNTRSGAEIFGR